MGVGTTGDTDYEIQAADGSWIPVMLKMETDTHGGVLEKTSEQALAASDSDEQIADALQADIRESWFRGVGLDYDAAFGVDTLDPDYACPAGAATEMTLPGAGGLGAIIAIEEWIGNIYFAQIGDGTAGSARVFVCVGGSGNPTDTGLALGANEYVRGMVAAQDGSGSVWLYAFSSDSGVQNGRVHRYSGAGWTSTAAATFGTNGRSRAAVVTWRDRQGINSPRIVCISGPRKISYTKPNADPMLAASWVEGVVIGTVYELTEIASAHGHITFGARDDVWDLDEVGNTTPLTSYVSQQVQAGNGDAVQYLDGSWYYSFGRGLLKINGENAGVVSEQPGQCAPGAFLPVEHCPRGYITAMTTDQGWLAANVFDTTKRVSGIFYGKSRESLGIQSPNPMIWHGPLVYLTSNYRATRMRTSALATGLRLWIAVIEDTLGTVRLFWVSRPIAGTTLQDQYAGGAHRVQTGTSGAVCQPFARLYMLKTSNDDKAKKKDLHQIVAGSRGLPGTGAKLTVYARADPAPGDDTWPSGTDVTTGPTVAVTPTTTNGQTLQYRVDFTATSGGATPPVIPYLDSLRITRWETSPSTNVFSLVVQYGDGVLSLGNGRDETRSVDDITDRLLAMLGSRTVIRDRQDKRRNIRLRQYFQAEVTQGESAPYGKVVTATLRYDDLGAVAA